MPAIAALTVADGESTPVNHTFSPAGINADGVAFYENRVTGIQVGYESLSIGIRRPAKQANGSRNNKVTLKMSLPTLEVTSPATGTGIQPAPTKAYDVMCAVEFVLPERCTKQERDNLLTMVANLLDNASVRTCIEELEAVY
jgi:hypothetical protein